MLSEEKIKKLDCGLFHCIVERVYSWDKEVYELIQQAKTQLPLSEYTVDIKVHMLMPNQYPCIPNWHYDMVPRVDGVQDFSKVDKDLKMYLWLSGPPFTEFEDGREVKPQEWVEFTQLDKHRGCKSTKHQWRMFIRLVPTKILPVAFYGNWKRRHTQVYLDSNNFSW